MLKSAMLGAALGALGAYAAHRARENQRHTHDRLFVGDGEIVRSIAELKKQVAGLETQIGKLM